MFKKIVVSDMGYPGVALAYWLRQLSPRVRILTPSLDGLEDIVSPRRWGRGAGYYSRRYVTDILGVEKGEEGDVYVEIEEPLVAWCGDEMPLYKLSTFKRLASSVSTIRGSGAEQIAVYLEEKGLGAVSGIAEIRGTTRYVVRGNATVSITGGIYEEEVEQAAAEAAMRIIGLEPGPRLPFEAVERRGAIDFSLGDGECRHSTRIALGGCRLRICTDGESVVRISGSECSGEVLEKAFYLMLGSETYSWMPMLAAAWSPLFPNRRAFAPLVGLWRKNIPRRILQLGEGELSSILV